MLRLRLAFPLLMIVAAIAAGCGGGGGAAPFVSPAPTATPTPNTGPTNIPVNPTSSPQIVFLASGNYTLAFAVPPVTNGGTATMNAVLQTTLPTNVNPPQARFGAMHLTPVKSLASIYNGLVYLVVSTTATVGFSSTPTFKYTVPSGAIPSGQHAYLLYWDPAVGQINGWVNLGVGIVSGNDVMFPGVSPYGITLDKAQSPYVFALAASAQAIPTATPAPTPTPTPNTIPAYCTTEGVAQSNGDTINLTDSSGLSNSMLIVYVQQQASSGGSTTWMNATGTFTSTVPIPLAAACYSSTQGSSAVNNPLVIPSGHAGRIYLAYAPAVPATASAPPNPFSNVGSGAQPVNGVASGQAPYIYDKIEYNSTGGVIDTTQVDFLGLPLEMNGVASTTATPLPQAIPSTCPTTVPTAAPFGGLPPLGTIVGVGQCGYGAIHQTLAADTSSGGYGSLVSRLPWTPGSSQVVDFRLANPGGSFSFNPFDYNLLGDPNIAQPAGCAGKPTTYGYLSCVLQDYQPPGKVFQALSTLGGFGSNDYYCITADSSNFIATDIGTAKTCGSPATPVSPPAVRGFKIPIALFTNAYYTSSGSSGAAYYGELFAAPYGNANVGPGQVFATADAFTLWKALAVEISYGTMSQPGPHPVETTPPSFKGTPGIFGDAAYNLYAKVVHQYFDGNFAYAISYDDAFKWYSGFSLTAPGTINIRVNPIPASGSATSANPSQFPTPVPTTFQLGVGSY